MNISGSYREVQIVNGQVVKDVRLEEHVSPEKDVIKGHINGKPVFITHSTRTKKQRVKAKANTKTKTKTKTKRTRTKKQNKKTAKK